MALWNIPRCSHTYPSKLIQLPQQDTRVELNHQLMFWSGVTPTHKWSLTDAIASSAFFSRGPAMHKNKVPHSGIPPRQFLSMWGDIIWSDLWKVLEVYFPDCFMGWDHLGFLRSQTFYRQKPGPWLCLSQQFLVLGPLHLTFCDIAQPAHQAQNVKISGFRGFLLQHVPW